MNKKFIIIVLVLLSIVPLFSLLHTGLPLTHDGPDHVARIANFYQAIAEGIWAPRWAANLNWGYGHPILMFLYPLPSYVASLFKATGFSFVDSTKLVFAVSFVTSTVAMFLWLSSAWGLTSGFVGALLYGFAPYRFVDLYVRGAIGEHVAFVFPPLIFWGLLRLARRENLRSAKGDTIIISLGFAGLILAHNAISLMFLPLIGLYMLYLWNYEVRHQKQFVIWSALSLAWGFLLSAFFWIPAFFEGKYTLRDIVTQGNIQKSFASPTDFFYMPWSWGGSDVLSKEIGWVQWAGIAGSVVVFFRTRNRPVRTLIAASLAILVISLWFMTAGSAFIWVNVSLLQKFQFPWRLLSVTTFVSALLSAVAVSHIGKRYTTVLIIGAVLAALGATYFMWRPSGYLNKEESYYTGIYNSTTDTGESSPIWSVRFMEKRPDHPMEIIDGQGTVISAARLSTKHVYHITAATASRILENTLYFPGWSVRVDGVAVPVEFQNPAYRGLMTFDVAPGEHDVVVSFEDTKVRKLANVLSMAGALVLLGYIVFFRSL